MVQSKPKIYLDIDGTLTHEDLDHYNQPANHLREFLEALQQYEVYWLTTHCRDGTLDHVHNMLSHRLPPELFRLVQDFKPTTWDTYKTEGISLDSDFLWIDNNMLECERNVLRTHGKEDSIIEVNLRDNPDQLIDIVRDIL